MGGINFSFGHTRITICEVFCSTVQRMDRFDAGEFQVWQWTLGSLCLQEVQVAHSKLDAANQEESALELVVKTVESILLPSWSEWNQFLKFDYNNPAWCWGSISAFYPELRVRIPLIWRLKNLTLLHKYQKHCSHSFHQTYQTVLQFSTITPWYTKFVGVSAPTTSVSPKKHRSQHHCCAHNCAVCPCIICAAVFPIRNWSWNAWAGLPVAERPFGNNNISKPAQKVSEVAPTRGERVSNSSVRTRPLRGLSRWRSSRSGAVCGHCGMGCRK